MTVSKEERLARALLSRATEPGDIRIGQAMRDYGPVETLERLRRGCVEGVPSTWQTRCAAAHPGADLAAYERLGARAVCPGDAEWPTQLDDLGDTRPYLLWVKGTADLRFSCLRSVAVVGSRAASAYGAHVAGEMAAVLAERNWTVVSGGAYGIDGAAHRGALAVDETTIVVLACGLDVSYPRGHEELFHRVGAAGGLLVSEWPPGATPTRRRFLVRNRVIAALTPGTVVVEAAVRSGALNTARNAAGIRRVVMAVPGPVTSRMSAGCHLLIRERGAECVTAAREVIDLVGDMGVDMAPVERGPVVPRDALDMTTADVLDALPSRGGAGPATIGVQAGVGLDTALRCLGELAAAGFVERCDQGWRLANNSRQSRAR